MHGMPLQSYPAPPMGGVPGILLLGTTVDAEQARQRLESALVVTGTPAVWEVARIEAGWPVMGIDMDEHTIPQEANLDTLGAISFSKGCYTGQETVARVHFRGHVNKHLRGLRADAPLPLGADVSDALGKLVGEVRSSVTSPRLAAIALAMIRREVAAGDLVSVATDNGPIAACVVELPFE